MTSKIETKEIKALTGLRGIAAIFVVLYHYQLSATGKGYLSVDLFFVLSGFVMTMSYSDKLLAGLNFGAYLNFLQRRFARIYPIYFIVVLLTFAMNAYSMPDRIATLITNLVLIQQFGLDYLDRSLGRSIVGQAWSISAEFGAYLVFPVLLIVAIARSRVVAMIAGGASILTLVAIVLTPYSDPFQAGPLDNHWYVFGLLRCVAEFVLGMLVYRAWRAELPWPAWLGLAVSVAICVLSYRRRVDLLIVLLFPLLVMSAAQRGTAFGRLLAWRPIHFIGEISYSLYMIHILVRLLEPAVVQRMTGTDVLDGDIAARIVLVGLDVAIATVCFYAIEKPARAGLRRVFEGRPPGPIIIEPSAP